MKAKSLIYKITYEVPTKSGNAVWYDATVSGGIGKLNFITLCGVHGYRVIVISRIKCYI